MNQVFAADEKCVLCGQSLSGGGAINREHYIPQVLHRNFDKLAIPQRFDWALRENQYKSTANCAQTETVIVPRAKHYDWATVRVHQKCNQDASLMCQHLKQIIDNLDRDPTEKQIKSITGYYAHIWGATNVSMTKDGGTPQGDKMLMYRPGLLNCGRIVVWAEAQAAHDYERHTIYLGTKDGLPG